MNEKKLIIIDCHSIIHRAFHALPLLTTKNGEVINAVYGFLLVFFKIIKELEPDFIAAAFDLPHPTFRHKKFKEYKAKRPVAPNDLITQFSKVKEILQSFNIPIFEKQGYEADDIIGTITKKMEKMNTKINVIIISNDTDTFQLINPFTKVYGFKKGIKNTIWYDENSIKKKYYGITSQQLVDFKALMGDASDNIPGVKGIGEKTAIDLILKFNNLENLYEKIEKNSPESQQIKSKIKELLITQKDNAFFSKFLCKIETKIPIDFDLEKCQWKNYDKEKVIQTLRKFDFQSLIEKFIKIDS